LLTVPQGGGDVSARAVSGESRVRVLWLNQVSVAAIQKPVVNVTFASIFSFSFAIVS
jgi:hypothetical protein